MTARTSRILRILIASALCAVILIAAGCGGGGGTTKKPSDGKQPDVSSKLPWPAAYRDAQRTGRSPYRGPDASAVKWTLEAGFQTRAWAVLDASGDVVTGFTGKIVCAESSTGKTLWEFPTGGGACTTARTAPDGTIYVCIGNKVHALGGKGQEKWSLDLGSEADEPSVGADGTVYVGSNGGRLVALSAAGKQLWEFKAPGAIRSPTPGQDGTLYCGAAPLVIYAIDRSGKQKWVFKPEGDLQIYPGMMAWSNTFEMPSVADDGTIYSGQLVTGGITSSGPIPNYNMPQYGKLYAVTPAGQKKWEYSLTDRPYAALRTPTVGRDGNLYCGTTCFKVVALRADGTLLWTYDTGEEQANVCPSTFSPPIGNDGLLYVATTSAKMICLTPQGTEKWKYDAGTPWLPNYGGSNNFTPPAMGRDGTLFSVLAQGKIFAFPAPAAK